MAPVKRGIWAETAPPEALRDPATFRLLARYALDVAVAVRPDGVALAGEVHRRAAEHGVRAALWPMIEDGAGRWLSAPSAPRFRELVRELLDRAPGADVVLDLEPPLPLVRGALDARVDAVRELVALVRGGRPERSSPAHEDGERVIDALCDEVRARGSALSLAVVPLVLFDAPGQPGWGRLFGPARPLPAGRVNVMLYTTLIAGYSRGAIRRSDALALLAEGTRRAVTRHGERAAVSLGAVGTGALGDEPVYADPEELAIDAATAEASGARDVWLLDLGGVLARGAPERWLDALVAPKVAPAPVTTARARAASALLRGLGRALAAAGSGAGNAEHPRRL